MSWKIPCLAIAFCAVAGLAAAQSTTRTTRETTVQNPDGSKTVTVTGEVVRYQPGQTIVLREPDRREVTFSIGPQAAVPTEVQIGKTVTLTTEPSSDGSGPAMVTRITTTSMNSEGQVKTTTERTESSPSGEMSKSTMTTVYGTVTAFQPGQSITIERPGHQTVTYTVNSESELPQDLAIGKTVTVTTTTVSGTKIPLVRKILYRKVTKTTTREVNPQ